MKLYQELVNKKLENDQFFDSSEEIKQLIDNEISVNDNDNNIENNVEENNDEIKKTNNDVLNGTKRKELIDYLPILDTVHFLMILKYFKKSSDLSIPPSYIIGPGDEIIIMLWGDTEDVSDYIVTRDGYIFIPNIGRVFVNGLNLAGLEKKLKKILQKHTRAYRKMIPIHLLFLMLA